jgi:hypothetical protein
MVIKVPLIIKTNVTTFTLTGIKKNKKAEIGRF